MEVNKDFNRLLGEALDRMNGEAVVHPSHYNRDGAMECINEMIVIFGAEATMHFCLLNAWKYRYRASEKNGIEDLKKSDYYLQVYTQLKSGKYNDYVGLMDQ